MGGAWCHWFVVLRFVIGRVTGVCIVTSGVWYDDWWCVGSLWVCGMVTVVTSGVWYGDCCHFGCVVW